jgi:hypothetical protein
MLGLSLARALIMSDHSHPMLDANKAHLLAHASNQQQYGCMLRHIAPGLSDHGKAQPLGL